MNRKRATEYAIHVLHDRSNDLRCNLETKYLQLIIDIWSGREGTFGAWKCGYYFAVQECTGIDIPDDDPDPMNFKADYFQPTTDKWTAIGGSFGAWQGGYIYGISELTDWKPEPGEDLILSVFKPKILIEHAEKSGMTEILPDHEDCRSFQKGRGIDAERITIPTNQEMKDYARLYRQALEALLDEEYWFDEADRSFKKNE